VGTASKKEDGPNGGSSKPVGVALFNYKANPESPGGFTELGLHQGMKGRIEETLVYHMHNVYACMVEVLYAHGLV